MSMTEIQQRLVPQVGAMWMGKKLGRSSNQLQPSPQTRKRYNKFSLLWTSRSLLEDRTKLRPPDQDDGFLAVLYLPPLCGFTCSHEVIGVNRYRATPSVEEVQKSLNVVLDVRFSSDCLSSNIRGDKWMPMCANKVLEEESQKRYKVWRCGEKDDSTSARFKLWGRSLRSEKLLAGWQLVDLNTWSSGHEKYYVQISRMDYQLFYLLISKTHHDTAPQCTRQDVRDSSQHRKKANPVI